MNERIIPTIALFLAIGIFFVYVSPLWTGQIAETKAAIASSDEALDAADRYTAQEKQLTDARNAIDPANLSKLATLLPDSVDNVGLILDLNALAAKNGLSLSNIDVSSNAGSETPDLGTGNPVDSVDIALSAIGSYTALKAFLSAIEKSVRLLDVREITLKSSETGVYSYQMKLRIYWLR